MSTTPIRLKSIALPTEHGGWGFLVEPMLVGMLAAPSVVGALLCVGTAAGFLLRHPYKIVRKEAWRSRRGRAAIAVSAVYAVIAGAAYGVAYAVDGFLPFVPFLVLSPFVAVFWVQDLRRQGRTLVAELCGPMGLAAVGPAITLAAGWDPFLAGGVWWALMARTIPSIFYVRARLRLERGQAVDLPGVYLYHAVFLAVAVALAALERLPRLVIFGLVVLMVRAVVGLSPMRRARRARQVGFREIGYGVFYAIVVAVGYRMGW